MKLLLRHLAAVLALSTSMAATAHEFWMWPSTFTPETGSVLRLGLYVGLNFSGDLTGFGKYQAVGLRHYSAGSVEDLIGQVPERDQADFPLRLRQPGTHVIAYDSQTNLVTLPADTFNAYLLDEGMEEIARQREAAGTAATPGRERFRRNVKTIVSVGGKTDASYAARTGQRLEMLPLSDPINTPANSPLRLRILFDKQPLANALVKAWHMENGELVTARARADARGDLSLTLPQAGPWMLSVVHMIPAVGVADLDWDSYWGNLTFSVPGKKVSAHGPGPG